MAVDVYSPQALEKLQGWIGSDGCIGASQAADLVGVTRQRVCQAICSGKLKASRCPPEGQSLSRRRGAWRIRPEDLFVWREAVDSHD